MKVVKKSYFDEEGNLMVKPYRIKDLAAIYDVSTKTMRKWIDNLPTKVSREKSQFYTIQAVRTIVENLGLPQKIQIKQAA